MKWKLTDKKGQIRCRYFQKGDDEFRARWPLIKKNVNKPKPTEN